jgi:hypothetical protein
MHFCKVLLWISKLGSQNQLKKFSTGKNSFRKLSFEHHCRREGRLRSRVTRLGDFFSAALWVIYNFVHFFLITKAAPILGLLRLRLCNNFDKKMGWATFWPILSQAHLVTVLRGVATWISTIFYRRARDECTFYIHYSARLIGDDLKLMTTPSC